MLILASGSPYRRRQLEGLGLSFEVRPADVDEEALKQPGADPEALALRLAVEKARAVARGAPTGAVVIGGDQLVAFEGEVLGKPGSPDRAVVQLARLAGRTHRLLTALAVAAPDGVRTHLDRCRLTMRPLDEAALHRYVALDDPVDCAGAYKFEAGGAALFERVEGEDPSAITGLPLIALCRLLAEVGVEVP